MKKLYLIPVTLAAVAGLFLAQAHQSPKRSAQAAYLGFDRNDYPGDADLVALREKFAFTGYWLNNPPGESSDSWQGKRAIVERDGFGFLLLFNGRAYSELKSKANPGTSDGAAAASSAKIEGFRLGSTIFLDQEEGGRMLPEQKEYVFAWAAAVKQAGYRPGIYCSGIEVPEQNGETISTARDLHDSEQGRDLVFWVANDACPPSPGCVFPNIAPLPKDSGAPFAEVWQFAQSPLRTEFAAACAASYDHDGNCYSNARTSEKLHLDLNSSFSPDPSHTRP